MYIISRRCASYCFYLNFEDRRSQEIRDSFIEFEVSVNSFTRLNSISLANVANFLYVRSSEVT